MQNFNLDINGLQLSVKVEAEMPLLWVLRDELKLTGTKFGCGLGQCGACTVLLDDKAFRACLLPVSAAVGKKITTIEGIAGDKFSAIQKAWLKYDVPQCGYCQSGQIMAATAIERSSEKTSAADLESALSPHLCRCGTYPRIKAALHEVFLESGGENGD